MSRGTLSERETIVLQALVEAYVDTSTPVGSRTLCARERWQISSATVRSTLASLEEKGYVRQPHTSAGRVPTDRAYRLYAADRMDAAQDAEERQALLDLLEVALTEGSYDEILEQLATVLGDVSRQLGLVLAPHFEQGVLTQLELLRLAEHRLLLVVSVHRGPVRSLVVEVDSEIPRDELEAVGRMLNERLGGLTMAEIRRSVHERVTDMTGHSHLVQVVTEEIASLAEPKGSDLHVAGTRHLCLQPEFRDPVTVAGLMDLLEHRDVLAHLLSDRRGTVITVGTEHRSAAMRLCSVVTASYEANGIQGVIGVIGPTRMPYGRVVSLVNCAAARVAALVS